jgi:hypothetical protein
MNDTLEEAASPPLLSSRLPSSRSRLLPGTAAHSARLEHARSFLPKVNEGTEVLEIVFPSARKTASSFIGHTASGLLPLRSRPIPQWRTSCSGDCLQCGERILGIPLPACNYKENDRYWAFGQFCRPCCALGYVLEHWGEAGASRCIVWTREMLSTVFAVPRGSAPSPPRFMLLRYGGPLTLEEFYGTDKKLTVYCAMRDPPLASFGMYMECVRGTEHAQRFSEIPSLESGNIKRPTQREVPLQTQQQTGRPPLLLELLATKLFEHGSAAAATRKALVAAPSTGIHLTCVADNSNMTLSTSTTITPSAPQLELKESAKGEITYKKQRVPKTKKKSESVKIIPATIRLQEFF